MNRKIEESPDGASPEEILELLHGFMILMEKHKLSALAKDIKDDEGGFNLYSRTEEILKKIYPERQKNKKCEKGVKRVSRVKKCDKGAIRGAYHPFCT
tara:strand:- start:288 stop:581 length:294 start_codon:yes stop_codon:yes gene_type:complete